MKTSISVPDDLWDCVKGAGNGPSDVVQQALTLLCQRLSDPMANAPSEEVKDRLRDSVLAQVERVGGAARKLAEDGYEFGVALASHLSLLELLGLPDPDNFHRWLRDEVLTSEEFLGRVSAFADFASWRSEVFWELDIHDSAADFWGHLELVLERHIEAAGEVGRDSDGTLQLYLPGQLMEWPDHAAPDNWWMPQPDAEIGRYFLSEGRLPDPYLRGIVGALGDIRAAAASYSGMDLVPAHEPPTKGSSAGEAGES